MLGALARGESRLAQDVWGGWQQLQGRQVIVTHQARIAIALALHRWGVGSGDEVLVPAYNCGTDIDPVIKSGAIARPYRVGSDLRLDLAEIRRLITPRTRVVYVIHYFGWPQELSELRRFCDETGIRLLEDCALALYSRQASPAHVMEGWLGQVGDGAVFSLPKTLGVPDGGVLSLKKPLESAGRAEKSPGSRRIFRKSLPLAKRFILRRTAGIGLYKCFGRRVRSVSETVPAAAGSLRPDIPADYYYDVATTNWSMSRLTQGLLRCVRPDEIIQRRRHNYLQLLNLIRDLPGVAPLFPDLPDGVCPIGLPILVSQRSSWERQLSARNIDVYAWWSGYHSGIDWDQFPEACRLKDQVMLLPIHQQLNDLDMKYIGSQVALIANARANISVAASDSSQRVAGPLHAA